MNTKQDLNLSKNKKLIIEIAKIGKQYSSNLSIQEIFPFEHYFDKNSNLLINDLDKNDGLWTRREILTRYLLVNAVLDQGPDMEGVRLLLKEVVNSLYKKEIRIFHRPLDFFKELGISIDDILEKHSGVKRIREDDWAKENNSIPSKYNLFFAQSPRGIVSTKQVLDYSVHRWGVPLCVPLLLEKDLQKKSLEPLVEHLEGYASAEIASQQIKKNERYGLGSAIGNKGCHLFIKWYIHTFGLAKRKDKPFGPLSYELPFDSNAGRVLFRTGFLLEWAELKEYKEWNVIQKGKGKGGEYYIRVTNIRGKKSNRFSSLDNLMASYKFVCVEYLKVRKRRPTKTEIQQIPNVLLLETDYGIGDLDESYEELMKFKKADAQLRIIIIIGKIVKIENLSLKKANSDADFNQIDKRWVETYQEIWKFDNDVAFGLKLFTGEINPLSHPEVIKSETLRDKRRMFLNELPEGLRNKILNFFTVNKILVVADILKGRGGLSASWMLITRYSKEDNTTTWILKDINTVMNFFGSGEVRISPRGSVYIGKITMMRKGGTPDPKKLQFKIKPCELFKLGK